MINIIYNVLCGLEIYEMSCKCYLDVVVLEWVCLQYLFNYRYKNGTEINKMYCYNVHSSGGLGMRWNVWKSKYFNSKNDKLIGILLFNSSYMYSPCKINVFIMKMSCIDLCFLSSYFTHVFLLVFCLSISIGLGWKGWFDVLIHFWVGYMVLILWWEHTVVEILAVCSVFEAADMVLWWILGAGMVGLGVVVVIDCWILEYEVLECVIAGGICGCWSLMVLERLVFCFLLAV